MRRSPGYLMNEISGIKMNKFKTAIIGLGKVGHLQAIALMNIDLIELVAVCGRNYAKTKIFADKYHIKAYTDVQHMVED